MITTFQDTDNFVSMQNEELFVTIRKSNRDISTKFQDKHEQILFCIFVTLPFFKYLEQTA